MYAFMVVKNIKLYCHSKTLRVNTEHAQLNVIIANEYSVMLIMYIPCGTLSRYLRKYTCFLSHFICVVHNARIIQS